MGNNESLSKQINDKRYIAIIASLGTIAYVILSRCKSRFEWKPFLLSVAICTYAGYAWQAVLMYCDTIPGWWYEGNTGLGLWHGFPIADLFFYPVCNALVYAVWLAMPQFKIWPTHDCRLKKIILFLAVISSVASFIFCAFGGIMCTAFFMIPGIVIFSMCFNQINSLRFAAVGIALIVGAGLWDVYVRDWHYITQTGEYSSAWLPYSWAWIKGKSPIEITPWFSICGAMFGTSVYEFVSKIIGKGRLYGKI